MANPCASSNGFAGSVVCYIKYLFLVKNWKEIDTVQQLLKSFLDPKADNTNINPADIFDLAVKLKELNQVDAAVQLSQAIIASLDLENGTANIPIVIQNLRFQADLMTTDDEILQSQQVANLASVLEATSSSSEASE